MKGKVYQTLVTHAMLYGDHGTEEKTGSRSSIELSCNDLPWLLTPLATESSEISHFKYCFSGNV